MTDVVKKGIDKVRLMCVHAMRRDAGKVTMMLMKRFDFGLNSID